jgi:cytochrome P450
MLRAEAGDGSRLDDDAAVLELHHVVVAGYIVFAELAQGMIALAGHGEIRDRMRAEVRTATPGGRLGPAELQRLPLTLRVVKELKRLTPIIPVVFGKAKTSFEFAGRRVPQGWMLLWAPHASMLWPASFAEPRRFDPDRFSPERAEDADEEHVYVPQGPGKALGHKCPGTDYATVFMQMFFALLVRDFDWELPEQNLSVAWNRIPPEPRDGLRMTLHRLDR